MKNTFWVTLLVASLQPRFQLLPYNVLACIFGFAIGFSRWGHNKY